MSSTKSRFQHPDVGPATPESAQPAENLEADAPSFVAGLGAAGVLAALAITYLLNQDGFEPTYDQLGLLVPVALLVVVGLSVFSDVLGQLRRRTPRTVRRPLRAVAPWRGILTLISFCGYAVLFDRLGPFVSTAISWPP